jgi:hypothetical protein
LLEELVDSTEVDSTDDVVSLEEVEETIEESFLPQEANKIKERRVKHKRFFFITIIPFNLLSY